jgi:peptidoglycan/xylan/chitin deacetylase (PgdA/CDA1 family)
MADRRLPVLMYHGLHGDARDPGRYDAVYSVHPDAFAQQLDWLRENGYRCVRLCDADLEHDAGEKRVVLSFDDGDISNLEIALPLLTARGMVAEFFVTTGLIGQSGMLGAEGVRTLARAGMGVQSHGCTHRYLEDLGSDELDGELVVSKRQIEKLTGTAVIALALPGGRGGQRERTAAVRAGYTDVLNSVPGPNRRWKRGDYLQRLTVTRELGLRGFAALVDWHGVGPRWLRARYRLLRIAKLLLGNNRYERLRMRLQR